jgi:hemerythrin-like metal-binding protein
MYVQDDKNFSFALIGLTLGVLLLAFGTVALVFPVATNAAGFFAALLASSALGALAAYAVARGIGRRFARLNQSIGKLLAVTEEIGNGDFDKRLAVDNSGQAAQMATAFNAFADKIADIIKRIGYEAREVSKAAQQSKHSSSAIAESANDVECRLSLTATFSENIVANANNMATSIEEASGNVSSVSASVYELSTNINTVAASAEQASTNMVGINHSFDRISQDINTVANSSEKMSVSMSEIAKNAQDAMRISADATASAQETLTAMNLLSETAKKIGRVVKLIDSIAGQTNMLALNATIEAASAGEAGKGFAVVAGEIKDLAQQTAEANNEIADQIEQIQNYAAQALQHTQAVNTVIHKVAEINQAIDSSVERQSSSANAITKAVDGIANASKESVLNLQEATKGLKEITRSAAEASLASRNSAKALEEAATGVKEAAHSSAQVSSSIEKINNNLHAIRSTLGKIMQEVAVSHRNADEVSGLADRLAQSVSGIAVKGRDYDGAAFFDSKPLDGGSPLTPQIPHASQVPQIGFSEKAQTGGGANDGPLIVWDLAIYSVGIKEIDRQHGILVQLINRLDQGVKRKISKGTLEDIANYLADYTVFHFGYEEKLLHDNDYPGLGAHKAVHQNFVNKVQHYQNQLKSQDAVLVAGEILEFLKGWLLDHIQKTDKQYGAFLNGKGVY